MRLCAFTLGGLLLATPFALAAQPADLEARLRALEARVAALEGRGAPAPGASAAAQPGFACTRLNANGRASPQAVLTVNVNGTDVGTFDAGIYADLETFMRPGPNTVRLTFSGPGAVQGELRCLPPGQSSSRSTILSVRPTAARLTGQAQVNLVRR